MHTSKDDYLINTLRFVSVKEETQIYGAILPDSLTNPEMKETKAYKTYLGFASRATPPKKATYGKSKRVKRPSKKTTKSPARGVVIRETPEIPVSKKKEKVDVTRGKGIELLSQVALTKDAQFEEVRKKSMRDFHKTHPSGSEEESSESEAESWGNDEDDRNNEQESSGEDSDQKNDSDDDRTQSDNENESNSKHETDENESGSKFNQDKNEEDEDDEEEVKDKLVKPRPMILMMKMKQSLLIKKKVMKMKRWITLPGTDAAMTNVQQGNENPKILQVIEDAHVTLSTVPQKTEVLVTSSSHSSDLAAKFLNFSDIPHTDAEIVSPMDVHVHHEVPSQQTPTLLTVPVSVISDSSPVFSTVIPQSLPSFTSPPQQSTPTPPPTTKATNPQSALPNFASVFQFNNRVTTLEKEVVELKKDPLHTQVTALVDDHLDARLGATRDEFMNFLSGSLTARITEQVQNQLP
ncbi:hypothetical protein Tco_0026906 [Tanacetum coccineum]